MRRLPEIVEGCILLDESDAPLREVLASLEGYRRFHAARLTRRNGIRNERADVPSETVQQSFARPLR
jgi:hypothetical protein